MLPEFLQSALLIADEEAQQSLPLQADDNSGHKKANQGDQDCHSYEHTVG